MVKGLVTKVYSNSYKVRTSDGYIECSARGIFKILNTKPLVGDRVEINDENVIEKIEKRKNEFIRPPICNIDQLVIVVSIANPKPDMMLLDKQLIMADKNGVFPIICINKMDLSDEYSDIVNTYQRIGYQVVVTDAKNGTGVDKLAISLQNKITAFTGNSGVGKSALTNNIFQKNISEEGETSEKLEKGKHTTKYVELYEMAENSYIADTPGFSTYELKDINYKDLDEYYTEFEKYREECEYRGCSHIKEKNCGIKKAVEKKKIDNGRYDRYCALYNLLKENKKW